MVPVKTLLIERIWSLSTPSKNHQPPNETNVWNMHPCFRTHKVQCLKDAFRRAGVHNIIWMPRGCTSADTLKTMQSPTWGWSIQNHGNGYNWNCGIGSTGWLLQSQSQPSASVSNSFSKSNNFIIKLTGCQCSVAREKTTQRKLRRQNERDDRRTVWLKCFFFSFGTSM